MFKHIFTIALLFMSANAFSAAGDWTPKSKISNIDIEGNDIEHVATITFENAVPESYMNDACRSNYITVNLASEKGKSMYSLILAARLADKEVKVTLANCQGPRPLVGQINL